MEYATGGEYLIYGSFHKLPVFSMHAVICICSPELLPVTQDYISSFDHKVTCFISSLMLVYFMLSGDTTTRNPGSANTFNLHYCHSCYWSSSKMHKKLIMDDGWCCYLSITINTYIVEHPILISMLYFQIGECYL